MPASRVIGKFMARRGPDGYMRRVGPMKYRYQKKQRPRKSVGIRALVKQIIKGNEETKYVAETILPATNFNSAIASSDEWYRCIPLLQQGDDNSINQSWIRDGKKVSPTNFAVHWDFHINNGLSYTRDMYVVLYVLQPKSTKQYPVVTAGGQNPTLYAQFLDDGQGNNTNFAGTWESSTYPVENDLFTLMHKKVFRLCKPSGFTTGQNVIGQGGTAQGYPSIQTGMYALSSPIAFHHTWRHKLPELRYDDGPADEGDVNTVLPTNAAPIWACGYYFADGSTPDASTVSLTVTSRSELFFKDA